MEKKADSAEKRAEFGANFFVRFAEVAEEQGDIFWGLSRGDLSSSYELMAKE